MATDRSEQLVNDLPLYLPNGDDTDNAKVLRAIGSELNALDTDISDVDLANTVQTATTIDQLWELAKLVDLAPESGESLEHYRTRVIIRFQLATSEGTIADIMEALVSLMPDLTIDQIDYQRTVENGYVIFDVPSAALDSLVVSTTELSELLNENVAAGFRVAIRYATGTFTYRTESDYTNSINDAAKGYDYLVSGVPQDTGGTYAGLIGN